MKEPEIRKPIEAGDQRKSVYKARFFDKYIKAKWRRQQVYKSLDFGASYIIHFMAKLCQAMFSVILPGQS